MVTQKKNKGFTIIEVVLVLAIAGLIFLMVFIALPAMQRGQRDQARKNDVSLVATAVSNYTGSNRGKWPADNKTLQEFTDELSQNSEKEKVTINTSKPTSVSPKESEITVYTSMKCGESSKTDQTLTAGSRRQFVVVTKLEAGGGAYFCQES